MSNIIRQYKIYKVSGFMNPETKEIIEFIQNILNKIKPMCSDKYPNHIFFFIEDKFYFEIESSMIWCRSQHFWEVLETKYFLEHTDIQFLIKSMVEEHFKMKGLTPNWRGSKVVEWVEEHYKNNNLIPYHANQIYSSNIEEHFKIIENL